MNFNKLSYIFLVLILVLFASCNNPQQQLLSSDKNITAFSFPQGTGVIVDTNSTTGTIAVTVPFGTPVTALVATFTTTGNSVAVNGTAQVSGTTANDFTSSVTYTVVAKDATTKEYIVTVTASTRAAGTKVTFTADSVSFTMVSVPGGLSFPVGIMDDVNPEGTVARGYWIGETEVTWELWNTVKTWATDVARGANIYTFANAGVMGSSGTGNTAQPVTSINWRDSMIWMNALTEWYNAVNSTQYTCAYYTDAGYTIPIRASTNNTTVTKTTAGSQDNPYVKANATGFRMLSIMEWELAARYKGSDSNNSAYEWPVGSGNWWTPGTYASGATAANTNAAATGLVGWYSANSGSTTHDVKGKAADALGLYDMSGNVWEWSDSWYNSGSVRVLRGGSWPNGAYSMQIGVVFSYGPYDTSPDVGFRLSRTDL